MNCICVCARVCVCVSVSVCVIYNNHHNFCLIVSILLWHYTEISLLSLRLNTITPRSKSRQYSDGVIQLDSQPDV